MNNILQIISDNPILIVIVILAAIAVYTWATLVLGKVAGFNSLRADDRRSAARDSGMVMEVRPRSDGVERTMHKCPWHAEKTPSLLADRKEGTFRCLSCGVEGVLVVRERPAPQPIQVAIEGIMSGECRSKAGGDGGVLSCDRIERHDESLGMVVS